MSNNTASIMAAAYLDQLITRTDDICWCSASVVLDNLKGSLQNPLQAMHLAIIDMPTENNYDPEELAKAVGAPVEWLTRQFLDAPIEEVIPALGRMLLIYLSSKRNAALGYKFNTDMFEDCLHAEATFAEVLAMNANLGQWDQYPPRQIEH